MQYDLLVGGQHILGITHDDDPNGRAGGGPQVNHVPGEHHDGFAATVDTQPTRSSTSRAIPTTSRSPGRSARTSTPRVAHIARYSSAKRG